MNKDEIFDDAATGAADIENNETLNDEVEAEGDTAEFTDDEKDKLAEDTEEFTEEEPTEPEAYEIVPYLDIPAWIKAIMRKLHINPYKLMQSKALYFIKKNIANVVLRLFAAYLFASSIIIGKSANQVNTLDFVRNLDYTSLFVKAALIFVLLSLLNFAAKHLRVRRFDGYAAGLSLALYAVRVLWRRDNFYYVFGVSIVIAIAMYFLIKNDYLKELYGLKKRTAIIFVTLFGVGIAVFIALFTIYRYLAYGSSTFDFGIFAQMYHYMKETLIPYTTCERNELLSHFAIHVSPIYYLLLPIYCIFPRPETLLVAQAIIIASGTIPLYMLCKHFKFTNAMTACICIAFCLTPSIINPAFYDFHENKFLIPLILWACWAIETKHYKLMYLFMILVLMVKEDAFIYVVCLALYMIFGKKKVFHGICAAIMSLLYFVFTSYMLTTYGRGVMEYRFSNLMSNPDAGLLNVITTVFSNPVLAVIESFEEKKIALFLTMLMPLALVPLFNKKLANIFLIIPFFLINLMPDYSYQNNFNYQYVCGVSAMLYYMVIINFKDMKRETKKYVAPIMVSVAALFFVTHSYGKMSSYDRYRNTRERIAKVDAILELIPENASVEATTFFVPQLSNRDELYSMVAPGSEKWEPADYVVIRVGNGQENYVDDKISYIVENGYVFMAGYDDAIKLYKYQGK